jgi:hypothetical protein
MFNNHLHWSETLKPGEEVTWLVSCDPHYHGPENIGSREKAIRITAGRVQELLVEMRLTATIIDEPGQEGSWFSRSGYRWTEKASLSLSLSCACATR